MARLKHCLLDRLLLEPNLLLPGVKPLGPVRINWDSPLGQTLKGKLKNLYLFDSSGGRCLITGNTPTDVGTGATYSDVEGIRTTGDTSNYILLPIDGPGASSSNSYFGVSKKISGSVNWSHMNNTGSWSGTYGQGDTNFVTTFNSDFSGSITPSGFLDTELGTKHWAATVRGTNDFAGASDGSAIANDTAVNVATNTRTEIALGLARRSTVDNASITEFKCFGYVDGALSDLELRELSINPYQLLKPAGEVMLRFPTAAAGGAFKHYWSTQRSGIIGAGI